MSLRISPDLTLPIETVTESIAILAKRGAGKTYAASVLVEEMLKAKLQVVVLDPMGAWWGLRSSADGEREGYPVAILGGKKGDVPLEPTAGAVVADLIVDERLPAILDISPFSKTERRRFVADFLERLYRRNEDAMHVVLEEADLFAPEGKLKRAGDEAMLGAVYDLVRRGRGRGIGSTLITQRSASLSKEVLTQAEILLALRTTGPQDVAAIREWIRYHGSDEERDVVLSSLHELPTGEAWAWWPVEGILKRILIRQRRTFDSSATPKPGQSRREPKSIADVDLGALQKQMAATIERAKEDDPRELRKRLAETQRALKAAEAKPTAATVETVVEHVEVPVLDGQLPDLREAIERMERVGKEMADAGQTVLSAALSISDAIRGWREKAAAPPPRQPARVPAPRREAAPVAITARVSDESLPKAERLILNVLAQHEQRSVRQIALLTGYSSKGGGFRNALGALRRDGLIEGRSDLRITDAGREAVGEVDPLPIGSELLEHWLRHPHLGKAEREIIRVLYDAYPQEMGAEEIAAATESAYSATGGGFRNALGKLRTLELIEGRGLMRASADLVEP